MTGLGRQMFSLVCISIACGLSFCPVVLPTPSWHNMRCINPSGIGTGIDAVSSQFGNQLMHT